jgi:hypothetical protein
MWRIFGTDDEVSGGTWIRCQVGCGLGRSRMYCVVLCSIV